MAKITQKSVCLYAKFSEKGFLIYPVICRHICDLSQKGEFMDSVDPRGNIYPRPSCRELSACSRLILAKNHLSKSNNLDMFALEANELFIGSKFVRCSYFLEVAAIE